MHLPSLRLCIAAAGLAALGACRSGPDPCVDDDAWTDTVSACSGASVAVIGRSGHTVEEFNAQVAQSHPSIALDAESVYWSDIRGRLLRTPKVGGATVELVPAHDCSIADLAVDDVAVYVGENCRNGATIGFAVRMRIYRVEKATGATTDLVRAEYAQAVRVVAAGGTVFFGMDTLSETFVRHVSRDGPTEIETDPFTPLAVLPSSWTLPMAVSGTDVYFANVSAKQILRAPIDGSSAPTLAYTHDRSVASLVDAAGVLHGVDEQTAGTWFVYRGFRLAEPSGSELVYGESVLDHLVGDATDYYAEGRLTSSSGSVRRLYRLPRTTMEPQAIAAGFDTLEDMALDASRIYALETTFSPYETRVVVVSR